MRILIVSQYFWPEAFRINDLAEGVMERGHHVEVLTGMPNYPNGVLHEGYSWRRKRKDQNKGISVYRVPLFLRRQGKSWQLLLNYISFVVFGCLLGPILLKGKKYDLIFVYEPSPITVGIPAIVFRWLKKAPVFFWVQDLWPETLEATGVTKSQLLLNLVGRMVRWIYRRCDKVLLQSYGFVDSVKKYGVTDDKILYFPNGAEEIYRPLRPNQSALAGMGLPDGFKVMFAGNIGAAQGFATILKAAELLSEYRDIHWVVLGDGRMFDWVQKEVALHGLEEQFHLLGRFPVEKMPSYFAHADALLVSLEKRSIFALTIPAKVQSYLACGRPIVAALDGEGARIVTESGSGLVAGSGDSKALASAVLELYHMPSEVRESMGGKARKYYMENFERGLLLDRLDEWFKHYARE